MSYSNKNRMNMKTKKTSVSRDFCLHFLNLLQCKLVPFSDY